MHTSKQIEPQAVSLAVAANSLSTSPARLKQEIDAGRMRAIRIGKRHLDPVEAISDYIGLLSKEADEETARRLAEKAKA